MVFRTGFLFICSCAAALFATLGKDAKANDFGGGDPVQAQANAVCAAYGPGFVAVEGGDTCVRIGGHVRVEFGSRQNSSLDSGWANGGTVPAAVRSTENAPSSASIFARPSQNAGSSPSHLRLRDAQ